uniref:All-trans-retinol 13,14-reductase n=1 Tax=Plectus sambesii TaxID=2011161 RepID=A0A914XSV0_9BILA
MWWLLLCVLAALPILLWLKVGKRALFQPRQFPRHPSNPFKSEDIRPPQPTVTEKAKRAAVLKQPFEPEELTVTWDAIVIGSGMGGLSVAAILSKAKWRVLVLEQHGKAGGSSHTFNKHGYEFDVGVHIVPQMGKGTYLRALSDFITNGQLDWAKLDEYFDVAYVAGKAYPIKEGGPVVFQQQLKEWFPDDAQDIDNYYAHVFVSAFHQ